jgi:hypothetical protein
VKIKHIWSPTFIREQLFERYNVDAPRQLSAPRYALPVPTIHDIVFGLDLATKAAKEKRYWSTYSVLDFYALYYWLRPRYEEGVFDDFMYSIYLLARENIPAIDPRWRFVGKMAAARGVSKISHDDLVEVLEAQLRVVMDVNNVAAVPGISSCA